MNKVIVDIPGLLKTLKSGSLTIACKIISTLLCLVIGASTYASGLPAYPNARIELAIDENRQNHPIITNRMKRVNGVVTSDGAQWLDGHLIRDLYFLPPGHSSNQGYEFYVSLLQGEGVETLFECRSFSCGASNFWANDVFDISTLYGQDKEQAFYIGNKLNTFYTVYAVRRGNGRIYTLVDIFKPHDYEMERTIEQDAGNNVFRLEPGKSGIEKSSDLASFITNMNIDSSMNALLIIHSTVPDTLAELDTWQNKMEVLQENIVQHLNEQGISESRLRFNISIGTEDNSLDPGTTPSFGLEIVPLN
ncbi:DUF4892 domain-containing protein [Endozoicomonas sp. GU-1]|uniref:DUF4892 domain-containing protein n=1 Tax=Endozoicomonas sp. GU-1 TaxID=3009078 RepID=UPI0022B318F0|nr:DUF4892 domain-containing protein [Endozoicomonas sp. GU-1]WBA79513.1 DUF4892 domain-containing protein [Endozoicomonas sp. GU-1]WBA87157.1 DUF4892 domain-containing protein [Endozoicomonas sp. GU-1]